MIISKTHHGHGWLILIVKVFLHIKTRQHVASCSWKYCFQVTVFPNGNTVAKYYCGAVASWNQSRKHCSHFQVSIASEKEFFLLDSSCVLEWLLGSSNSERSSWGKGTLQYWKELYLQSSFLTSASTWNNTIKKTCLRFFFLGNSM